MSVQVSVVEAKLLNVSTYTVTIILTVWRALEQQMLQGYFFQCADHVFG